MAVLVPVVIGAVALAAVVFFLVSGLSGSSSGASDPESAVRQLAAALQKRDLAAAIGVVNPEEVGTLSDLYDSVEGDLGGSGGGGGSGERSGLELDDLQLSEEPLGTDVTLVRITGGALHGTVPAGDLLSGFRDSDSSIDVDLGEADGPAELGLFLVTRKVDGSWYVSPTMTALQYLVDAQGLSAPSFTETGNTTLKLGSPAKLSSALAEAIGDRDVSQLLDLVSAEEANAVRPYTAALQELVSGVEGAVELELTDSDFTEHDLGSGLVRLDLDHVSAEAYVANEYDSERASLELNGFCGEVLTSEGSSAQGCDSQVQRLTGANSFFVVARREDGGLRLAPFATIAEYGQMLSDQMGPEGVRRASGEFGAPARELGDGQTVEGQLNQAGFDTLAFEMPEAGLVAVEADQYVALFGDLDGQIKPLGCPNGVQVYAVDDPGRYTVVVASGAYEPGAYTVTAETLEPRPISMSDQVSGTIGNGVRVASFAIQEHPIGELAFYTDSEVESELEQAGFDGDEYCAGAYEESVDRVAGPLSALDPLSEFEPSSSPGSGWGESYEYLAQDGSAPYLLVAGERGTSFSGHFEAGF